MLRAKRPSGAPLLWRIGAAERPAGPHLALAPGAEAPLLPVELPDTLRGLARERVARRQLAEALATPPEGLEVRPFAQRGAVWRWALVVDARRAAEWRAQLRPGCIGLLPDYLALPCAPGVWTLETHDGAVLARLGVEDGFSAEPELALRLLGKAEKPRAVLRLGPPDAALDGYLAGLGVPVCEGAAALAKAGAGKLLRWAEAAGGIDLKQPPSALYDRLGQSVARWRWPALLGAVAVALYLAGLAQETRLLRAEAARAAAQTRDLVRAHFVPEGPVLDIRAQVQAVVDAAAGPEVAQAEIPPLVLFQQAAPLLTRDALRLQQVDYRADTGLVAAVAADDFAALDAAVADLRGGGFLVEMLDSRSQASGGVAARLRLQAEPGP